MKLLTKGKKLLIDMLIKKVNNINENVKKNLIDS
jgi:hypothetical protein